MCQSSIPFSLAGRPSVALLLVHSFNTRPLSHKRINSVRRGLVRGVCVCVNNSVLTDCPQGAFLVGCKFLCCDLCGGVLRWLGARCSTAALSSGNTYLQVWFSISQRGIYGLASAVPCEWCKDRLSLPPLTYSCGKNKSWLVQSYMACISSVLDQLLLMLKQNKRS